MKDIESNMERLPSLEIKAEIPSVENETNLLVYFCDPKTNHVFAESIFRRYPEIQEIANNSNNSKEFRDKIYSFVKDYHFQQKDLFVKKQEEIQAALNEIGNDFFSEITNDFETDLPTNIQAIRAFVSMCPVNPRYLDIWSFGIFIDSSKDRIKYIAIHEMVHFFWFKKWLEVFPGYNTDAFDSPNSEWRLSEMVAAPIINNNLVFQKIVGDKKQYGYNHWSNIRIEGKSITEFFWGIYKKHLYEGLSFDEFIKKSWEAYKINRKLFDGESDDAS